MDQIKEYEAVADAYQESMRLPFRDAIEQHTLMATLGDVAGAKALDMACGDGYYTRLLKRAGAAEATGIDVSAEMVRRAEELEKRDPLGCVYRQSEVAEFEPPEPADVIVAMYSLQDRRAAPPLLSVLSRRAAPRRPVRRCQRQPSEYAPVNCLVEEVRPGEDLCGAAVRGGRRSLDHHQPRRTAVRSPELLSDAGDVRARLSCGWIRRVPLGRSHVGAIRAGQSVLGRLPGTAARHRVRSDAIATWGHAARRAHPLVVA